MEPAMKFFRELPPKRCRSCGSKMKEQAESYIDDCETCAHKNL
ncbi:protein YhfH [Salsuginibacillus halophilus]|nr:protein YhfH [Salsuginibacillus halophilus]